MASRVQRKPSQTPAALTTPLSTPEDGCQAALLQAQRLHTVIRQAGFTPPVPGAAARHVDFQEFVSVVDALESQRHWLTRAVRETTLAQQSIRGDMRDAFTISPALFQATLFLAGTFSNTCGLSYADVKLGVGMAFMRGASLDAVRGAITAQQGEHWVSMAVALLAGWELRFGDRESYNIHMTAYRQLFGSPLDLKENSIAMMRDFAFESLREQLNNLVLSAPLRVSNPAWVWHIQPGFDVFSPVVAPEVKSLFAIIRDTATFDPRPPSSLQFIRNQGLVSEAIQPGIFKTLSLLTPYRKPWPGRLTTAKQSNPLPPSKANGILSSSSPSYTSAPQSSSSSPYTPTSATPCTKAQPTSTSWAPQTYTHIPASTCGPTL